MTFQKPLEFGALEFMFFNAQCHSERSAAERRISRKVEILKNLSVHEVIPPYVGMTFQKTLEFDALPFWNFKNILSFL